MATLKEEMEKITMNITRKRNSFTKKLEYLNNEFPGTVYPNDSNKSAGSKNEQ